MACSRCLAAAAAGAPAVRRRGPALARLSATVASLHGEFTASAARGDVQPRRAFSTTRTALRGPPGPPKRPYPASRAGGGSGKAGSSGGTSTGDERGRGRMRGPAGFQYGVRNSGRPTLSSEQKASVRAEQERESADAKRRWRDVLAQIDTDVAPDLRAVGRLGKGAGALHPGDFVEISRLGKRTHGIVLDLPPIGPSESEDGTPWDDGEGASLAQASVGLAAGRTLFVLETTGNVDVFRDTDAILAFPALCDADTARAATPALRKHVGNPRQPAIPAAESSSSGDGEEKGNSKDNAAGAQPAASGAGSGADKPATVTLLEEPVDQTRFQARAELCTRMRIFMTQVQRELQRQTPAFTELFLVEMPGPDTGADAGRAPKPEPETQAEAEAEVQAEAETEAAVEPAQAQDDAQQNQAEDQSVPDANAAPEAASPSATASTSSSATAAKPAGYANIDKEVSTLDACRAVLTRLGHGASEPVTRSQYLATHMLLMSEPVRFMVGSAGHRQAQRFQVRAADEVALIRQVTAWLAAPEGAPGHVVIAGFTKRARAFASRMAAAQAIRRRNRKMRRKLAKRRYGNDPTPSRTPTWPICEPKPMRREFKGLQDWVEDDEKILRFLMLSLGSRRLMQEPVYAAGVLEILRRADAGIGFPPAPFLKPEQQVQPRAGTPAPPQPRPESGAEAQREGQTEKDRAEDKDKKKHGKRRIFSPVSSHIEAAGEDLQHALVFRFLQDIGILPPWQNPVALDSDLIALVGGEAGVIEHHAEATADADADADEDANADVDADAGADTDAGGRDKSFHHRMPTKEDDAVRVEVTEPVFVIDAPDAHELDDGISVERVAGSPDQVWVHVHIADPTSVLKPDDTLSAAAAQRVTSIYFPEMHWPLLPPALVGAGVGLGTGPRMDNGTKAPQRAMTFSAKVGLDGTVHDYRVQLSLLKNVQVTSYDAVDKLLSSADAEHSHWKDLELLAKVAHGLQRRRWQHGAIVNESENESRVSDVSVRNARFMPTLDAPAQSYIFVGAPHIRITYLESTPAETAATPRRALPSAKNIVEECMVLAGRIAGQCGADWDLPLPYRAQPMPEGPAVLKALESTPRTADGALQYEALLRAGIYLTPALSLDRPAGHFGMGIPGPDSPASLGGGAARDALSTSGYVRATSPLRRYHDMIVHWQLRHMLLSGSKGGVPWTREALLADMPKLDRAAMLAKRLERSAEAFWICTRIQQILEDRAHGHEPDAHDPDAALRRLVLGDIVATVTLPDVRINPATLLGSVRVRLDALGGIGANCHWPRYAPAGSDGSQPLGLRLAPSVGEVLPVRIVGVMFAGLSTTLHCELAT